MSQLLLSNLELCVSSLTRSSGFLELHNILLSILEPCVRGRCLHGNFHNGMGVLWQSFELLWSCDHDLLEQSWCLHPSLGFPSLELMNLMLALVFVNVLCVKVFAESLQHLIIAWLC